MILELKNHVFHHLPSIFFASIIAYVAFGKFHKFLKGRLPPGPKGVPFLGNLFQLTEDAWVVFTEWKHKFGDLVYISVAGQDIVILNSHKVATDLLDRRAGIYSDRQKLIVASELMTDGLSISLTEHNDVWRRMRRASHAALNNQTARNYFSAQEREAVLLVAGILKDPKNLEEQISRAAYSVALGIMYGEPSCKDIHNPMIVHVKDVMARLTRAAFPGAHYAEFFCWMKYLPRSIAKWKRDALQGHRQDTEIWDKMYTTVEDRIKSGDETPSVAAVLIHDDLHLELSRKESIWMTGMLCTAGTGTTDDVLLWFIIAMIIYPEVQKKAQSQLDTVVGRDRMPSFADHDHLPYITAAVREILRWKTVPPIGVPHKSTEDDVYEGYFIPKGTICIPNQWSMNKDPAVYGPDADQFRPERHLDKDGNLASFPDTHDGHVSYGFGRRICPGRYVANNALFINIANLLWATTIAPLKDANGKSIIPDTESMINEGLVLRPVPFQCSIIPRFPEVPEVVAQMNEVHA